MRENPKQRNRSDDVERTVPKGFARGLLILGVLGLSLAIWHRSDPPPLAGEQIPSARSQGDFEIRPARRSGTGSRGMPGEIDHAAAAAERRWQELRAVFLAAEALGDALEQEAALSRCMEGMTPEMAATLLAALRPEELKGEAAQRLFDHWASAKPGEAAGWAQNQADPQTRQSFLNVAAVRWAASDLSEAVGWARGLPEGEGRTQIMAAVGSEAVRSDPLEALRLGVELPAGAAQADLICRAAAEWAGTDRDGAMEWAEQIEDKNLRQQVTAQVVVASAEQDPAGAATIALQQMFPGEEQDRAVVSIVQRWVQTDPAVAAAWVSEFPEGAVGRDAMDNLVNLWADRDLVASGNWLLTLPAGAMRNTGVLAYSHVLRRTDAPLAEQWAASVTGGQ